MKENKELIKLDRKEDIVEFLQRPTIKIAEALTSIFASNRSDLILSAGRLVQAAIKGNLLKQLGRELKTHIKNGKIKEDYFATKKKQTSLYELLKFIDEDTPDEERFNAMKSIFFVSISKNISEKDGVLAYELMQICKKLNSGDLLVLKAAYDVTNGQLSFEYREKINSTINGTAEWLKVISRQIGHDIPSLVEAHEKNLIELTLITDRKSEDRSRFFHTSYFRLTDLGYKLCEFITKY